MNPSTDVLFSSDLWETALQKYAVATHMTVKLFDAELRTVSGPIHPTPLFRLFDERGYDPGIFAECVRRCIVQTKDRAAVIVSQFHGLAVVGTSLVLEGKIVGAAVGGYVLADFSQVSEIQSLARQAGIAFDRLWEIARQQQPVPQNRLIVNGELLQVLGDALLRENYRTRQNAETAAIVASSDDAIISKDLNGVITSWNRGAERIFGYTSQEAIGQSITMLIPRDQAEEEPMILNRIRRGEAIDHYETVRRRKDGSLLDISLTISPIRDAQGRITGASKIARDITERKRTEEALRVSEAHLQGELADTKLLHGISSQLIQEEDVESLYERILDGAVSIMRSDFASMQMLHPERGRGGELRLLAFRGFSPQAAQFWEWVGLDSPGSTCGAALRTGQRVVATDVEKCEFMTGTDDQAMYLQTGIHACQTTPLISRDGKIVGMISTHWRNPHQPSERDLRVFDILARQAADLIERNKAQDAIRKSEEHYRILFDLGPVAVYSCDGSGVIQEFNHRAAELWGRAPVIGDTDKRFCGAFKLFRPDGSFMPHEQSPMAKVVKGEMSEARDAEVRIERPDHTQVTVIVNIRPLKAQSGEIIGAINCFYDITQRKQAEEALQQAHDQLEFLVERRTASLRRLSSHLQHVQDEERRHIARNLHDSAGQYLVALKMNLAQLNQPNLTNANDVLAESNQLVDSCLCEIRTISYLLHPPMLDESGLASAAAWYVEGFAKRSGIQANLEISPRLERLPRDVEMVLFRALQESLTNVHRHSQSRKVNVRIGLEDGHAALVVRDYGRGFRPEQLETFRGGSDLGVGLAGMRERVNELGGLLEVLSEEPGTSVRVTLAIAKAEGHVEQLRDGVAERGSAA
ncbi:MAG TPA: PAS domain S-box protein [Terriglobales bacterium]|nr:PAS domain S-box protein [Terriglobales bacterium]